MTSSRASGHQTLWHSLDLRSGSRRLAVGVIAPVAVLTLVAACSSSGAGSPSSSGAGAGKSGPAATNASPYVIADIGSTNPAATGFEQWRQGVQTYFDMTDDNGGVNGKPVKLLFADDRNFDTQTELSAYNQFVHNDHADMIIGLTLDSSIPVIAQKAEADHVPTMLGSGSERSLMVPVQKYIYDASPDFRQYLQGMLGGAAAQGLKKVALVLIDSAASRDAASYAQSTLASQLGVDIVSTQFTPLTSTDYSSQLQAAQRAGATAIASIQSSTGTITIAKAMQSLSYKATVYGVAADTGVAKAMQQLNTPYIGVSMTDVNPGSGTSTMSAAAQKHGTAAVLAVGPSQFGDGWVAGQVIVQALKSCGPNCSPDQLNDALQQVSNLDTGGLSKPLSLTAGDHNLIEYVWPTEWKGGKLVSDAAVHAPTT